MNEICNRINGKGYRAKPRVVAKNELKKRGLTPITLI